MKLFVAFLLLVVALVAALPLLRHDPRPASTAVTGLPWQIESVPGDSIRVFDLTLGRTTLGEAESTLGPELRVAIIAGPGETGGLEAYHGRYTAGVLAGKLVLGVALTPAHVEAMKARAIRREPTATGAWRYLLAAADHEAARRAPVQHVTFIPRVQLDAEIVHARFGAPAERVIIDGRREHWLYPHRGLDLLLDVDGPEVLQYVAPREFERVRRPLLGRAGR